MEKLDEEVLNSFLTGEITLSDAVKKADIKNVGRGRGSLESFINSLDEKDQKTYFKNVEQYQKEINDYMIKKSRFGSVMKDVIENVPMKFANSAEQFNKNILEWQRDNKVLTVAEAKKLIVQELLEKYESGDLTEDQIAEKGLSVKELKLISYKENPDYLNDKAYKKAILLLKSTTPVKEIVGELEKGKYSLTAVSTKMMLSTYRGGLTISPRYLDSKKYLEVLELAEISDLIYKGEVHPGENTELIDQVMYMINQSQGMIQLGDLHTVNATNLKNKQIFMKDIPKEERYESLVKLKYKHLFNLRADLNLLGYGND